MFTVYEDNKRNEERSSEEDSQRLSPKRCTKIELKRIRDHWTDFCNVTSVHGVRYLAATDRPLFERLWWASVLAVCFYYATIYAAALWKRWLDSPVEHTTVITYENVIHIPLPAITFCNNMKSTSDEKVSNYESHNRRSDWTPEAGYKDDAKLTDTHGSIEPFADGPYPKRASGNPMINILHRPSSTGSYCRNEGPGIQVAVHSPHEMPVIGHRAAGWVLVNDENTAAKERSYTKMQYGFEYAIELDPERTWASEGLRIFMPHQRKCYFQGEKTLVFFKFYTKSNCENECLINRTIFNCKCVDFYMPHLESTRICSTEVDIDCIVETMDWWERRGKNFCNCYPSCSEINYNAFIFGKNMTKSKSRDDETPMMRIAIYTPDEFYMSRENKQSQWTIIDLVASCGGVFGLLCGMSLIGVVEFLYYATIRVISNVIRRRGEERRGVDQ